MLAAWHDLGLKTMRERVVSAAASPSNEQSQRPYQPQSWLSQQRARVNGKGLVEFRVSFKFLGSQVYGLLALTASLRHLPTETYVTNKRLVQASFFASSRRTVRPRTNDGLRRGRALPLGCWRAFSRLSLINTSYPDGQLQCNLIRILLRIHSRHECARKRGGWRKPEAACPERLISGRVNAELIPGTV